MADNIVTRALAERDQAAAFERARAGMGGSGFRSLTQSLQDPNGREAFKQAYEIAEQKRKAETSEARTQIATERLKSIESTRVAQQDIAKREADLRDKMFEMKQKETEANLSKAAADLALKQHQLEATMNVTKQTTDMFTKMETLRDEKGLLSPSAIASLRAEFPDAAMHANNSSALNHEVERYDSNAKLQAAAPKAAPSTYVTTKVDADGKLVQTVHQPLQPGDADPIIKAQHDALEAKVNTKSGQKQDPAEIATLNSLKAKLGYAPVNADGTAPGAPSPVTQPSAGGNVPPVIPPTTTASAATPDPNDDSQPNSGVVSSSASQPDPRIALAQQAINDPSASEDHKAAARKILGL